MPQQSKLTILSAMRGSYVPTDAERNLAADLFHVTVLPPPAVPRPLSPPPSTPLPAQPDSALDWLFEENDSTSAAAIKIPKQSYGIASTGSTLKAAAQPQRSVAHPESSTSAAARVGSARASLNRDSVNTPGATRTTMVANFSWSAAALPFLAGVLTLGGILIMVALVRRIRASRQGGLYERASSSELAEHERAAPGIFLLEDDEGGDAEVTRI